MATLSKLILPVKRGRVITDEEFDLPSGGSGGSSRAIYYGTCSTAAGEQIKVVNIPSDQGFSLFVGCIIAVKYTYQNTYNSVAGAYCLLNVNNTGGKPVYWSNAIATGTNTTALGWANHVIYYMYDGTNWVWFGHSSDNNTTYSPQSLGFGYGTCTTAYITTAKVVTLASYNLIKNGIVSVRFSNAINANATLNINSKGAKPIFYRGKKIVDGIIKGGDVVTFIYDGANYQIISMDNPWRAEIQIKGDPGAIVTVTNSVYGVSDTVALDSKGFGIYIAKVPGNYTFSVEDN